MNILPTFQSTTKEDTIAWGEFKFDSAHKQLHFVEDTSKSNKTSHLDVIVRFEEVKLYFSMQLYTKDWF